jgi:hypothetical protein
MNLATTFFSGKKGGGPLIWGRLSVWQQANALAIGSIQNPTA